MNKVQLYQFELCPFCHKVKAALDLKAIPYAKIEVNPVGKKELPELPEGAPRKVPVLRIDGEIIYDSTTILAYLEAQPRGARALTPADEGGRAKDREIEAWVDNDLAKILPIVIYGKWRDALRAARVVAQTSNFGPLQNLMVRGGGSLIMHKVAKRLSAERGGGSGDALLTAAMDSVESWLGDGDYLGGEVPTVADAAVQGCLTCVRAFPAFDAIMARPRIAQWFQRVERVRANSLAASLAPGG